MADKITADIFLQEAATKGCGYLQPTTNCS